MPRHDWTSAAGATQTVAFSPEEHPLCDCDGVVENLYAYLWAKNSQGCACPGVRLPQTVVYRERAPDSWFFFSKKEGTIMRKRSANLVGNAIAEAFGKAAEEGGAAGTLLFPVEPEVGGGGLPQEGGGSTVVWHMNAGTLRQWVLKAEKPSVGVLQAFVEPRELSNTVIRANWSPQLCMLERRTNRHPLSATKVDLAQRLLTFEGAAHCSHSTQIAGEVLPTAVREVCNNVVEHIADVSGGEYRIARMVLNFKVDRHQQLQLLHCSSLRLEGGMLRGWELQPQAPANMSPPMLPVSVAATTAEEAGRGRAVSPPRAAGNASRSRPTSGTVRASPHTASRSTREAFVCVVDGLAHDASERCETTFKTLLQLAEQQLAEGTFLGPSAKAVPVYIQRADPIISLEKFRRVRHTLDFLYRKADVCSACSRQLVEVAIDAISEEAFESCGRDPSVDKAYATAWDRHAASSSATPASCPPPHDQSSPVSGSPQRSFSARGRVTGERRSNDVEEVGRPRPHSAAPTAPPYWRGGAELPWRRRGSKAGDPVTTAVPLEQADEHLIGPNASAAVARQRQHASPQAAMTPQAFLPKKGYHAAPPPAPSAAHHVALEVSDEHSWVGKRSNGLSAVGDERPGSVCHDIPEGDENNGSQIGSPLPSPKPEVASNVASSLALNNEDSASPTLSSVDETDSEVSSVEPDDPVVRAILQRFPGGATEAALHQWIASGGPPAVDAPDVEAGDGDALDGVRELLARAALLMGFAPDGSAVAPPLVTRQSAVAHPDSAAGSRSPPAEARQAARRRVASAVTSSRDHHNGAEWRLRNALSEDGSTDAYDALGIRNDDSGDAAFLADLEDEWETVGVWTDASVPKSRLERPGESFKGVSRREQASTGRTVGRERSGSATHRTASANASSVRSGRPLSARPTIASVLNARHGKGGNGRTIEQPIEPPSHPRRQEQLRSVYAPHRQSAPKSRPTAQQYRSVRPTSGRTAADTESKMLSPDVYFSSNRSSRSWATETVSTQPAVRSIRDGREHGASSGKSISEQKEKLNAGDIPTVACFAGPARLTTDERALLQEMLI